MGKDEQDFIYYFNKASGYFQKLLEKLKTVDKIQSDLYIVKQQNTLILKKLEELKK